VTLAARLSKVKPSATMAITAIATELKAAGRPVISLGAGEPDFDTPQHIKAAAIAAINAGDTKYTAVDGTREFKEAIQRKFKRDNGLDYALDQILVSAGGKQSCYNLCQALLGPGDEVVVPAPYWVSYPEMVKLADADPVIVATDRATRFTMTPEQLDAAITPRTRLLILNSPSNPAGTAYTYAQLKALGEVLDDHPHVVIATDDMYEHIYWAEAPFSTLLNAAPQLYDRTLTLNGVSKAYAMTGWRIGYCGGPKDVIAGMKKVQSQSTSGACTISQAAALAALDGDHQCVRDMCAAFRQRHDVVVAGLNTIPGFQCLAGDGTFYAFPDVSGAIATQGLADDVALCAEILKTAEVALVPGSAFGCPGHLRMSYATDMATLEEALSRIRRYMG
jgi:aspartate aminotransferase